MIVRDPPRPVRNELSIDHKEKGMTKMPRQIILLSMALCLVIGSPALAQEKPVPACSQTTFAALKPLGESKQETVRQKLLFIVDVGPNGAVLPNVDAKFRCVFTRYSPSSRCRPPVV